MPADRAVDGLEERADDGVVRKRQILRGLRAAAQRVVQRMAMQGMLSVQAGREIGLPGVLVAGLLAAVGPVAYVAIGGGRGKVKEGVAA